MIDTISVEAAPDTLSLADEMDRDYEDSVAETKTYFGQPAPVLHYDSLKWRRLPDSFISSSRTDEAFWYAGKNFRKEKVIRKEVKPSFTPLSERAWFQALMWLIIIVGFGIFIISYLINNNTGLFRKANRQIGNYETELEEGDIFSINYQREIDKATREQNYRLGIRLMFLRLLRDLSEKNIIQYKQDRTNLDYLLQLRSTRYYDEFFRVTRNYEYSWYGKFNITEQTYHAIRRDFDRFMPSNNIN